MLKGKKFDLQNMGRWGFVLFSLRRRQNFCQVHFAGLWFLTPKSSLLLHGLQLGMHGDLSFPSTQEGPCDAFQRDNLVLRVLPWTAAH